MSKYILLPNASDVLVEIATGTAIKTVLQVATPSTTGIKIYAWGVSFEGIVAVGAPGEISLIDVDVAATVTSRTPDKYQGADSQNSLCVGGTSASGSNATVEGTITNSRFIDGQKVHPQTGYSLWFPSDCRPIVKVSRCLRIRTNFAVDVGCIPWIVWGEPN